MPTSEVIDALGKVGSVGALLLAMGFSLYVFLKGGSVIRDSIVAVDRARAEDRRESAEQARRTLEQVLASQAEVVKVARENAILMNRVLDRVTHLAERVEAARRPPE